MACVNWFCFVQAFLKNTLKVGALLVRPGQNSEEAMLRNQHVPGGPFDELLKLLGDRVALKGFNRFLGGLDAHSNLTGKESVFTEYKDIEIMFHVSTLLPYSDNDHQQVSRGDMHAPAHTNTHTLAVTHNTHAEGIQMILCMLLLVYKLNKWDHYQYTGHIQGLQR